MGILKDKYGDWRIRVVVAGLLLAAPLLGTAMMIASEVGQCRTLTSLDQDHSYRWTFWMGCLAQTESGRWLDADDAGYLLIDTSGN